MCGSICTYRVTNISYSRAKAVMYIQIPHRRERLLATLHVQCQVLEVFSVRGYLGQPE